MHKKIKKQAKYIQPFLWAIGIAWRTDKILFICTNISSIATSSLSGIINTYLLAQATASVAQLALGNVSIRTPILWTIAFGLFTFGIDAIRRITTYFDMIYNSKLDVYIQNLYASKVSLFTQEQLDNPKIQSSLSIAQRELYAIRTATNTIQEIVASLFSYIFIVIVVWQYAWGIGVMLSILVPILVLSNAVQTKWRRQSWKAGDKDWRITQGVLGYLTDPLRLFQLRIMGAREHLLQLLALHNKKAYNYEIKAQKKNTYVALAEDVISPIIEVSTRVWAIVLVAGARLTFDQFLFVIGLINQASSQTYLLGWNLSNAQETYIAASALRELLATPNAPDGNKIVTISPDGGIDILINKVHLQYPNGTPALKDITMQIEAGSKIAIVGENGAGKTSLLRLITRQYEPTMGDMFIGGQKANEINRESLYSHLSVLSQDYYLIDELTIKENLQIASKSKISHKAMQDVLEVVGMKQKISRVKGGLNARLNKSYDDGVDLSGGQRQRLAIARALLKPFNMLILDEPTSAIDAKAERAIFNAIYEKSEQATVLIVSHRFATVRKADYIYVLSEGKIIEQGSHQELMALNGHYAELYTIQAQDFV
jgi:ATP-binding cassette subfamily B protein